jgi:hypothetical protein
VRLPGSDLADTRTWLVALLLLAVVAAELRLAAATRQPLVDDEVILIERAAQARDAGGGLPAHGGDHPFLGLWLVMASGSLFGASAVGFRALAVVAGVATVGLAALAARRRSGPAVGLVAGLLLAVDPFHVALSARAIELPYQLLFVALAGLALTARPLSSASLAGAGIALGLAFLCSESAALLALAWAAALLSLPEPPRGRALVAGLGALALVILPDIVYNLRASEADYRYVNYLDHLQRLARPDLTLQGAGFFLKEVFDVPALFAVLQRHGVWSDDRCEYAGHGLVLGVVLLAGFAHVVARAWRVPQARLLALPALAFFTVTSLLGPIRCAGLDSPQWTWLAPVLPLVVVATAELFVGARRRLLALALLLLLSAVLPALPAIPCP